MKTAGWPLRGGRGKKIPKIPIKYKKGKKYVVGTVHMYIHHKEHPVYMVRRNNMGTFTSIVEQLWTLLQGNVMFLLQTLLGFFRSGSGPSDDFGSGSRIRHSRTY